MTVSSERLFEIENDLSALVGWCDTPSETLRVFDISRTKGIGMIMPGWKSYPTLLFSPSLHKLAQGLPKTKFLRHACMLAVLGPL